jgi:hypothetical protein
VLMKRFFRASGYSSHRSRAVCFSKFPRDLCCIASATLDTDRLGTVCWVILWGRNSTQRLTQTGRQPNCAPAVALFAGDRLDAVLTAKRRQGETPERLVAVNNDAQVSRMRSQAFQ